MRNRLLLALAATVFGATSLSAQDRGPAENAPKLKEGKPGLVAQATISPDSALGLAQAKVPNGTLIEQEIEYTRGRLMYNFEFKVPGKPGTEEVNVDGKYGTVSDVVHDPSFGENVDKAGEKVGEGAEKTKDAVGDAAKATGKAIKTGADTVKNRVN